MFLPKTNKFIEFYLIPTNHYFEIINDKLINSLTVRLEYGNIKILANEILSEISKKKERILFDIEDNKLYREFNKVNIELVNFSKNNKFHSEIIRLHEIVSRSLKNIINKTFSIPSYIEIKITDLYFDYDIKDEDRIIIISLITKVIDFQINYCKEILNLFDSYLETTKKNESINWENYEEPEYHISELFIDKKYYEFILQKIQEGVVKECKYDRSTGTYHWNQNGKIEYLVGFIKKLYDCNRLDKKLIKDNYQILMRSFTKFFNITSSSKPWQPNERNSNDKGSKYTFITDFEEKRSDC